MKSAFTCLFFTVVLRFFFFIQVLLNNMRNLTLSGHVGFDSLPDQLVNKSVCQGFCFNILCVGMYISKMFICLE